ncbi:glutaredoxin family protein [Bacillus sp. CGMCC 1.16541]|jgi:glutaredoxin|uniref:glutaredoxin family protein n=1 Tax=Bacillus sp. CGMCC 1.16541 TaxID=2185143 RepID=UPI000D739826|nr:glutaredoxin family protein [Bacillus sp. CGMCC 1.16541]
MNMILYTRKTCPLCDKAKVVIEELQEEFAFSFNEQDIYEDDQLLEKYQLMIPVVEIDGIEVAYGQIKKDFIRKRLLEKMGV